MKTSAKTAKEPKREATFMGIPVSKLNKAGLYRMNNPGGFYVAADKSVLM